MNPTNAAAFALCLHTFHEVVNERSHQFATTKTKCTKICLLVQVVGFFPGSTKL